MGGKLVSITESEGQTEVYLARRGLDDDTYARWQTRVSIALRSRGFTKLTVGESAVDDDLFAADDLLHIQAAQNAVPMLWEEFRASLPN